MCNHLSAQRPHHLPTPTPSHRPNQHTPSSLPPAAHPPLTTDLLQVVTIEDYFGAAWHAVRTEEVLEWVWRIEAGAVPTGRSVAVASEVRSVVERIAAAAVSTSSTTTASTPAAARAASVAVKSKGQKRKATAPQVPPASSAAPQHLQRLLDAHARLCDHIPSVSALHSVPTLLPLVPLLPAPSKRRKQ